MGGGTLLFVCLCLIIHDVLPRTVSNRNQAMEYLKEYKYMGPNAAMKEMKDMPDDKAYPKALEYFQNMLGLEVTGVLDAATMTTMGKKRCGVSDMISERDGMKRRRKRYALQGYRWSGQTILYKFINHTRGLPEATTEQVIAKAFKMWSDVTPLQFTKRTGSDTVDIEISFPRLDHGDGNPFDGPGGTLAHAFFPNFGGDAHFDEDEDFTDKSVQGINLLFVAVHEFGHSLGLGHSNIDGAIMFPTYSGYRIDLKLHDDDIAGIQVLYGEPIASTTVRTTPTTTPTRTTTTSAGSEQTPDFCNNSNVDAIFRNIYREIYVFQGNWYAMIQPTTGIVSGYPRRIQAGFNGLPGNLDAAVEGFLSVYFFKGSQIWKYDLDLAANTYALATNYPKDLATIGLPSDIDMAFTWSATGRTYVTKGSQYYRMSYFMSRVDRGYPRNIGNWNIPGIVTYTDAFSTMDRTFFFAGDKYIRYNDVTMKPDAGFPKKVRDMWFGCTPDTDMEMDTDQEQFPTVIPRNPVSGSDMTRMSRDTLLLSVVCLWMMM